MDLREYYRKVREAEERIAGEFVVVVSEATPDRGKAGVPTEVSRATAARMIADGRARLATEGETREFHESNRKALARAQRDEAARRLQVMVIPQGDIEGADIKKDRN